MLDLPPLRCLVVRLVLVLRVVVRLVPVRPIKEMRGFLEGIETSVPREKEDRV